MEANNRLIAEFMNYQTVENGYLIDYDNTDNNYYLGEHLKFHSSWDWLMPVVEKIEREHKANFITKCRWNEFNECSSYQVIVNIEKGEMSKDRSYIYDSKKVYDYIGESIKDNRKATNKAVVEFIKWYNENK